jgi:hypothetical protein
MDMEKQNPGPRGIPELFLTYFITVLGKEKQPTA